MGTQPLIAWDLTWDPSCTRVPFPVYGQLALVQVRPVYWYLLASCAYVRSLGSSPSGGTSEFVWQDPPHEHPPEGLCRVGPHRRFERIEPCLGDPIA